MQLRLLAAVVALALVAAPAWAQIGTGAQPPQMSKAESDLAALRENMGRQMSAAHTQQDNMAVAINIYIQELQKQLDAAMKRERGWEQYSRPLWEPRPLDAPK